MSNLFQGTVVMNLLEKAANINTPTIWSSIFSSGELDQFILDLIRLNQLYEKGVDENGNVIGYYSWTTENFYNPEKKEGTHYTLKDTGKFYASMEITLNNLELNIDADPMKTDESGNRTNLFEKYGEGIIGLTEESKGELRKEVLERCIRTVENLLY